MRRIRVRPEFNDHAGDGFAAKVGSNVVEQPAIAGLVSTKQLDTRFCCRRSGGDQDFFELRFQLEQFGRAFTDFGKELDRLAASELAGGAANFFQQPAAFPRNGEIIRERRSSLDERMKRRDVVQRRVGSAAFQPGMKAAGVHGDFGAGCVLFELVPDEGRQLGIRFVDVHRGLKGSWLCLLRGCLLEPAIEVIKRHSGLPSRGTQREKTVQIVAHFIGGFVALVGLPKKRKAASGIVERRSLACCVAAHKQRRVFGEGVVYCADFTFAGRERRKNFLFEWVPLLIFGGGKLGEDLFAERGILGYHGLRFHLAGRNTAGHVRERNGNSGRLEAQAGRQIGHGDTSVSGRHEQARINRVRDGHFRRAAKKAGNCVQLAQIQRMRCYRGQRTSGE